MDIAILSEMTNQIHGQFRGMSNITLSTAHYDTESVDSDTVIKETPITKIITCMKIYL